MKILFARLQLWKKFALLGVIGLALFGVPTTLYIISAESVIAHKAMEMKGVVPARALLRSMQLMQQHRGMSAVLLGGNSAVAAQRQAKAQEVNQALQDLQAQLKKAGVRNPAIGQNLDSVVTAWNTLRDGVAAGQVTAPQSFSGHSDGIVRLFEINDLILDDFRLSLDPDLDSSKLISGGFIAFPLLTEELGKMRARGSAMLGKKVATPDDKLAIISPRQGAVERLRQADQLFQQAFLINASLKDVLGATVADAKTKASAVIALADEKVLKAEALEFPAGIFRQVHRSHRRPVQGRRRRHRQPRKHPRPADRAIAPHGNLAAQRHRRARLVCRLGRLHAVAFDHRTDVGIGGDGAARGFLRPDFARGGHRQR